MQPKVFYGVLAALVLAVFYPAIFAESLSTDDLEMIQGYLNTQGLDWQRLFFPATEQYYYRPLLGVTFWFDQVLFGHQTAIVHLENIFLHLANTMLLYRLLLVMQQQKHRHWALLGAVFFAVHPLVTEPVNWISGRTDLLAGFFVLASAVVYWENTAQTLLRDVCAALLFLCGLWSKEVAIGLLPVVVFAAMQGQGFALRRHWRTIALRCLPFVGCGLVYAYMRTGGQFTADLGVMAAAHGRDEAALYSLASKMLSLVKTIGFYAQKMLWPFPLNFAIADINRPVALTTGLLVIGGYVAALALWIRRSIMPGLVWMACFLAPALLVAVNRVAWTPLAERYLYLPLMGFCMVLLLVLPRLRLEKFGYAVTGFLLLGCGAATVHRNIVWQKNITLWQDVVEKSPNFGPGHNDYALALMHDGRQEEARWHLARAEALVGESGKSRVLLNKVVSQDATFDIKINELDDVLVGEQESKFRAVILKKMLQLIANAQISNPMDQEQRLVWTRKTLGYQKQLSQLDGNPYHLYRIGQLHLALGEKAAARVAFEQTCRASNDYYTLPACTLARRFAQESAGQ